MFNKRKKVISINNKEINDYVRSAAKKSSRNSVFKALFLIYLVVTIVFFVYIVSLNMLPTKYLIVGTLLNFLVTFIVSKGMLSRSSKVVNILSTFIGIVLLFAYSFLFDYAKATTNFIDTMSENFIETDEYCIVALSTSSYSKIEDIAKKQVYAFTSNEDYSDIKDDILSKTKVTFKEVNNLITLANDLLNSKKELILLSFSQYSMIDDEIKGFKEKTKIIYKATHNVKTEIEKNQIIQNESNNIENSNKYSIQDGCFNVYISGIDTYGNIANVSRSDVNMVISVNTNTNEILFTSIPRDYYVKLHTRGAMDKLTHTGIYGINETVTTVEDLLDIDINYYVRINFTTVIKVVDLIGGINVSSDYAFTSFEGYSYVKGNNYLDGKKALSFCRERYSFAGGDNQRVKNQQYVLEAIVTKLVTNKSLLIDYPSMLNSLNWNFQSNINQNDMSILVKKQLDNMSSWTITKNALVGTGDYATTYSMGSQKLYVMRQSNESINQAKAKIDAILNKE